MSEGFNVSLLTGFLAGPPRGLASLLKVFELKEVRKRSVCRKLDILSWNVSLGSGGGRGLQSRGSFKNTGGVDKQRARSRNRIRNSSWVFEKSACEGGRINKTSRQARYQDPYGPWHVSEVSTLKVKIHPQGKPRETQYLKDDMRGLSFANREINF